MTNNDIIYIKNCGAAFITAHMLEPADAYKVYKFKRFIEEKSKELSVRQLELASECNIKDIRTFNTRLEQLQSKELDKEESKELANMEENLKRFNLLVKELMNEVVDVSNIKKIKFISWFTLQNENKAVSINGKEFDILSGKIETLLEEVLWELPEE